MPAPYLDPQGLYGRPEVKYIVDWIKNQIGYDTIIDPTLTDASADANHDDGTIGLRPPCCLTCFHSRAGRMALTIIGKRRGELWFPEFSDEPHLRLINGGAS